MLKFCAFMTFLWMPLIFVLWLLLMLFVACPLLFVRAFFKALAESFAEYPAVIFESFTNTRDTCRGAMKVLTAQKETEE